MTEATTVALKNYIIPTLCHIFGWLDNSKMTVVACFQATAPKKNYTKVRYTAANCSNKHKTSHMRLYKKHDFPGKLFVVEGVDGSGKSTQLDLLRNWLESKGESVIFTEWNSSNLISKTIKQAKRSNSLIPVTFSILHATDFADRLENIIIPALKAGLFVLADRYCFTAFARDVSRGVDKEWVRNLYGFAIRPDGTFYFQVPVEVSLGRINNMRAPGFYESGMDLGISNDPRESFRIFQSNIINEYDQMVNEFEFHVMPATQTIHEQQMLFRQKVSELLKN